MERTNLYFEYCSLYENSETVQIPGQSLIFPENLLYHHYTAEHA